MAWSSITSMAGGNSKTSTTTLDVTIGATGAAAGAFVIVCIATDNIQTTDVTDGTDISGVTDSVGNLYYRAKTFTNGQGSAAAGATCGIYYSYMNVGLATNDVVTVTFGSAVTAKAASVNRVTLTANSTVRLVDFATAADDGADPSAVTISGLPSQEYLWVHAVAHEGVNGDSYTEDADYSTFSASGTTSGSAANMSIRGGARIFTGTTDTVDVTYTSADHAQVYVAFAEVPLTELPYFKDAAPAVPQRRSLAARAATAMVAAMPFVFSVPYINPNATLSTDQWGAAFSAPVTQPQSTISQPVNRTRWRPHQSTFGPVEQAISAPSVPDVSGFQGESRARVRRAWPHQTIFGPVEQAIAAASVPDVSQFQGQMPVRRKALPTALIQSVFAAFPPTTATLQTDLWGAAFAPAATLTYADFTAPYQRPRQARRAHQTYFGVELFTTLPVQPQGQDSQPQARRRRVTQESLFGPVEQAIVVAPTVPDLVLFEATRPSFRRPRAQQQSIFEATTQPIPPYSGIASEQPRRKSRPRNIGPSVFQAPDVPIVVASVPFSGESVSQPKYRKRSIANVPTAFQPPLFPIYQKDIQSTAHILEPPGIKEKTIGSAAFIVKRRPISVAMPALLPSRLRFVVEGPSKVQTPESV